MTRALLLSMVWLISFASFAKSVQAVKYPVSAIPDTLMKGVNAVIREDVMDLQIVAKDKAVLHVLIAVTILNSNAKEYAQQVVGYDKMTKVTDFKGTVFDEHGNVIKKLKKTELYDQAAYDGFTLYSDNRLKAANLSQGTYPYTVEYEYTVEQSSLFHLPGYSVLSAEDATLEHGRCSISYPTALRPRFKEINITSKHSLSKSGDNETIWWVFEKVWPIKAEPVGAARAEKLSRILIAPTSFDFDGYEGSMQSWDEFGQWIAKLNNGRDVLPPATIAKINSLTHNLRTVEEKTEAIYRYMQEKTRYVGIQLGIGGFQPFEATVVDQTGYGDCKALSNYTISLLGAAGIKANYVLIKAGPDYRFEKDFVSTQFNHVVVAVPNQKDTIWLECTSQTNPFGYMGSFTGDREALMITDRGAKVVRTPRYGERDNLQSRKAKVVVDNAGNAKATVTTVYQGLLYEKDGLDNILSDQFDDQKKWIEENTDIPAFDLANFKMKAIKTKIPQAVIETDLSINRLATVSGKRLLFAPNIMNKASYLPPKVESRKSDVVRKTGYVMNDTIDFEVPEGIYPEFLPEPVKVDSRFGQYEMKIVMSDKGIRYIRRLKMNKGTFPPDTYQELVDFYKNIGKADNTKLVFLNKT